MIKTLIFDVDGVLTDGSFLLSEDSEHLRFMNIKDGYALQKAVRKGYTVIIISGNKNESIRTRLESLGIKHIILGRDDKDTALQQLADQLNFDLSATLFMGDDMPDLKAMKLVGLPVCPADAATDVLEYSQYISPYNGGKGCVRDVLEKIMKLNNHWY